MSKPNLELSQLIIKGQNHYKGNIASLFDAHSETFAHEMSIDGILEPEPTNGHDPNAVVLKIRGYTVGYVAQQYAGDVKKEIGSGIKVTCKLIWNRDPEQSQIQVVVVGYS